MAKPQLFDIIYKRYCELAVETGLRPSENEMARYLGVSAGQVRAWKGGQRPSADALEAMVRKLGLAPRWLLTSEGPVMDGAQDLAHHGYARGQGGEAGGCTCRNSSPLTAAIAGRLRRLVPDHAVGIVAERAYPGVDADMARQMLTGVLEGTREPSVVEFYSVCVALDLSPEAELQQASREAVVNATVYEPDRRDPFEVREAPTRMWQLDRVRLHEPDPGTPRKR